MAGPEEMRLAREARGSCLGLAGEAGVACLHWGGIGRLRRLCGRDPPHPHWPGLGSPRSGGVSCYGLGPEGAGREHIPVGCLPGKTAGNLGGRCKFVNRWERCSGLGRRLFFSFFYF